MSSFKNPYFSKNVVRPHSELLRDPEEEGLVISFTEAIRECRGLVYQSANTCWWTSNPNDLIVRKGHVPTDIFGSPLFETENFKGWFNLEAVKNHPSYGKEGRRLRNFMLAHSKNIHLAIKKMPEECKPLIKDFTSFVAFCDEYEV